MGDRHLQTVPANLVADGGFDPQLAARLQTERDCMALRTVLNL